MHMRLLVPCVAALVPLVITPGLFSYFDVTPKVAILLLGAALILLYSAINLRNLAAVLSVPKGRVFVGLIAAQWLVFAVATLLSSNRPLSLNGGNWRRFGLMTETALLLYVLCAAAWIAQSKGNALLVLRASAFSGALASFYGIVQYFGWDPLLPAKSYQVGEGVFTIVRPPGTLGHADYFAAWLTAIVFLAIELARREQEPRNRFAAQATAILASISILLSGTRAALLGLVAGALICVILLRPRVRSRGAIVGICSVACLIMFFFSPAGTKLRARLQWIREDVRGGARLLLWRDSARMALDRPLIGFGPETFGTDFPRYESIELARAYPDFYHESPHNIFLDALTSQGLGGLLILLGLCALGLSCILRAPPALAAAFAALLLSQQFIVFIVPTALFFYLILAFLILPSDPSVETNDGRMLPLLALRLASVAAALLFLIFAIRLTVADQVFATAQRDIAPGNVNAAVEKYRTMLRWQPAGSGSDLAYSRAMSALADREPNFAMRLLARQQALEAGARATTTAEDRQNAWYNLAQLFAATENSANVEHALRNAIAWAPNWFKPHWALAQLLELTGHHDQALTEARAAVERDAGHNPEVTETLNKLTRPPANR